MANTDNRSDRSRRIKGALAAVAGVSLLLGGTFALWSDSETTSGQRIINGDLDVQAADTRLQYWDVSSDRPDADASAPITGTPGHVIEDAENWSLVPGDTVQATYLYQVAVEGDNLVADLTAGTAAPLPAQGSVILTGQAYLWNAETAEWVASGEPVDMNSPIAEGGTAVARVQAPNQSNGRLDLDAHGDPLPVLDRGALDPSTGSNVALVIWATLPADVTDREGANAVTLLSDVTLAATQVRN